MTIFLFYLPDLCIGEDIPGFGSSPIFSKVPKRMINLEFRRFAFADLLLTQEVLISSN